MITFFDAWWYLQAHTLFKLPDSSTSFFDRGLDINVVRVVPGTGTINLDDDSKNTELRVWLEVSTPVYDSDSERGDWHLVEAGYNIHASGSTFEKAIMSLFDFVKDIEVKQCELS